MSDLSLFQFEDQEVRTVIIDGDVWFVAKDVCDVLGIANNRDAISNFKDYEKNTVVITDGTSGNPNLTAISESGLYRLIFKSRKPIAEKFQDWICQEVIPSIRETGKYEVKPQPKLPPDEVAVKVAHNIRDITDTLEDQPKLAQFLIDHAISHLISEKNAQITGSTLKGIVEIATELGYTVTSKNRSTLGRFCAKQLPDLAVTEQRLVNGQMRAVKCYPDNNQVKEAIKAYFS